jgi:hypothetical protein
MKLIVGVFGARRALRFGITTALFLGLAAPASAQMKEGTLSGTFAAFGTAKATTTGKERLVLALEEDGLSVTNGLLDHVTWHCSGLANFANGVGQAQGFCAGNDPMGDQVVFNWESERHIPDQGRARNVHLDRWHREIRGDPRRRDICGLRGRIPAVS